MSITFAWRSNQYDARYSVEGVEAAKTGASGLTLAADANCIGGTALQFASLSSGINWIARNVIPPTTKTFSVLFRFRPNYSGNAGARKEMLQIGAALNYPVLALYHGSTGNLEGVYYTENYAASLNFVNLGAWDATVGSYYDFVFMIKNSLSSDNFKLALDGSTKDSRQINNFFNYDTPAFNAIGFGRNGNFGVQKDSYLNEIVVWDEIIDPTNVTLVDPNTGITSSGQSLNGASRTGWVDVANRDWLDWTSLAASDIRSGTTQVQAGLTATGTLAGSSDPGVGNVRSGTEYVIEGTTLTGTLSVPAPASGTAGTVDLNNILEQVQYALETANVVGGSPIDLSNGLTNRVVHISKVNPSSIMPHRDKMPSISVWIESVSHEMKDIALNQTIGRRQATITIKIAGMLYLDNFGTADENVSELERNLLMENIERVIRGYDKLGGSVDKQKITGTVLFDVPYSNQVNLKAGVITIEANKFY